MTGRRSLALLTSAVLLLAACGSGGDDDDTGAAGEDVLAELAAFDGPLAPELVARAEAEGELLVYTSNSDMEDLADAFGDEYDIEVTVYRAGSETVVQRALQEADAGRIEADVIETHGPEMEFLAADGLFVPYDHGLDDRLRPGSVFDDWTAVRYNAFVVAWNESVLGDTDPPRSWTDLGDDRWDGLLSLEAGDFDWYVTLRQHLIDEGTAEADVDALFARIASGARVVDGHTAQAELLGAGELGLTASSFTQSIEEAREAGAPVAWQPAVEPLIVKPAGIGMVKGQRHPAAAALFYEWLLTDAQELMAAQHRIPASADLPDPLAGHEVIPVELELLAAEGTTWSRRYQELLG